MMENSDEISIVQARHRKEKKDLQGKIQALKKLAKSDKSKKKELTSEISRLETEMEDRHAKELEEVTSNQEGEKLNTEIQVEETVTAENKQKVSKAQKRRDKKIQQEKEREEQIILQEKENIKGRRHTEIQSITERLKSKGLQIHMIPSDGDCLYKAVAHQLQLIRQQILTVAELRNKVASYIRDNKDDFLPFMSNPDTFETITDIEFEEYCSKISSTKVWGGHLEIRALSNILKCPIKVILAVGPDSIDQGEELEGPPLVITYHRHMYQLGEHYNSTQFIDNDHDDEKE